MQISELPALVAETSAARPLVLNISTAARELGVSRSYFYDLIAAGTVRVGKIAGRSVVARAEIERVAAIIANGEAA